MADQAQIDRVMKESTRLFEQNNPGQKLSLEQREAMRTSIEKNLSANNGPDSNSAKLTAPSAEPAKGPTALAAEKAKVDRLMKNATDLYQKENPGEKLTDAQTAAMRLSIEKNLAAGDSAGKTAGSTFSTAMTVISYGSDGSALFAAGAKGNIPGQLRSYGFDLRASAADINTAGKSLITEGLTTGAGRSAGMSTLKATGAVLGRLAIPLTVGFGAYETYDNIKEGNRKGAYQAGTGTALSLGASIAAGAAVGTLVTPLVGTIVGAGVGIAGYYLGRLLGGAIADATEPTKDFNAAAAPAPYTAPRTSASFDPKMFQGAPASQTAFSSAVKPVGVDVTKVADADTKATNDQHYKKAPVLNYS